VSDAFAPIENVAGEAKTEPLGGLVIVTVGGTLAA
jgi:hypothetical protein